MQLANPNADAQKRMKRRGVAVAAMTCRGGRGQWPRGQGRSPLPLLARPLPPRRAPAESPHRLQGRKHSDKQTWARDNLHQWLKVLVHGVEAFTRPKEHFTH